MSFAWHGTSENRGSPFRKRNDAARKLQAPWPTCSDCGILRRCDFEQKPERHHYKLECCCHTRFWIFAGRDDRLLDSQAHSGESSLRRKNHYGKYPRRTSS